MKAFFLMIVVNLSLMANDMIVKESEFGVAQTIENIKRIVEAKGFSVFAVIDHQANAVKAGLKLDESQVIIFGNPKIGTLLMQENSQIALDLPLKILVYREKDKVKIVYRDGSWIKDHHFLASDDLTNKVNTGMNNITDKSRRKEK